MESTTDDRVLTSAEAAEAAGLTFRQLDYLTRSGVVQPKQAARGTGSTRGWGVEQVKLLRLAAVLRDLGANEDVIRPAIAEAVDLTDQAWSARVLVTRDGRITTLLGGDANGYAIDLARCRDDAAVGILIAA